jgi:hypothetical protein
VITNEEFLMRLVSQVIETTGNHNIAGLVEYLGETELFISSMVTPPTHDAPDALQ